MLVSKKITDSLIIISETDVEKNIIFCMQLVIGKKRAALIDSGLKKDSNLLQEIKSYTDLPVALYLTHGHSDHVGNAELFDEVHISELDAWMLNDNVSYLPLSDGEKIDLGDVVLEAYALSGHTDGGFCFLNKNDGYALTGDIINRETWLCWDHCATPEQYAKKVADFSKKMSEYEIDTIFEGHSDEPISLELCDDMIKALNELSNGSVITDKEHHTEVGKIKCAHSYGSSTIIYDKERMLKITYTRQHDKR